MTAVAARTSRVREGARLVRSRVETFELQLERAGSIAEVVQLVGRVILELRALAPEQAFGVRFPRTIATREDIEHWTIRMGPPPRSRDEVPSLSAVRALFVRAGARMNDLGPRRT